MHDSVSHLERLHRQRERFGFPVSTSGWMRATRRQRLRRD